MNSFGRLLLGESDRPPQSGSGPIRTSASSPKRSPVGRRQEHECDRASGRHVALPSGRWCVSRPRRGRTAPSAAMRSRKVAYACGPVTPGAAVLVSTPS
jgi:hypothetical protein